MPRATVTRAAAAEAALSAFRANTAKALASALNGKALGGIVDSTAGALSGSLPIDPITAVIVAGRNSTVRLDTASYQHKVSQMHSTAPAQSRCDLGSHASTCCQGAASIKAMQKFKCVLPPTAHDALLCLCLC